MNFTISNPEYSTQMFDKVIMANRRKLINCLTKHNTALSNLLKNVDTDGLRLIYNFYADAGSHESSKRVAQVVVVRFGMAMNDDDYQLWTRRASG